jgi:NADH:ubiquinone oxidoreductase subunit 2 (subunit N)
MHESGIWPQQMGIIVLALMGWFFSMLLTMVDGLKKWCIRFYAGWMVVMILWHFFFFPAPSKADPIVFGATGAILITMGFIHWIMMHYYTARHQTIHPMVCGAILLSMIMAISATNCMLTVLSMEVQALSLAAAIAGTTTPIEEKEPAIKSAILYFIINGCSMGLILMGILVIYAITGSLEYVVITKKLSVLDPSSSHSLLSFAQGLMVLGLCGKLGLFPFYTLMTRVYQGCSSIMLMMVCGGAKVATLVVAVFWAHHLLGPITFSCKILVFFLAVLSCIVGGISAKNQYHPHVFLGFSGAAQLGFGLFFSLIPSCGATAMYYAVVYGLLVLVVQLFVIAHKHHPLHPFLFGRPQGGLYNLKMVIGLSWCIFSFIGFPMTPTFMPKVGLVKEALAQGWGIEAFLLLLVSILSAWGYITLLHTLLRDHGTKSRLMIEGASPTAVGFSYAPGAMGMFYVVVAVLIAMSVFAQKTMMLLGL